MSPNRSESEPITRRTWLLALLAFVLMWAWVLVAQQRVEARHPVSVHGAISFDPTAGRLASRG
jgi:hypothetical protein